MSLTLVSFNVHFYQPAVKKLATAKIHCSLNCPYKSIFLIIICHTASHGATIGCELLQEPLEFWTSLKISPSTNEAGK